MTKDHERLKYFIDLQKLQEPVQAARIRSREETLRFCLWEVGIATGALLILGTSRDSIADINSWTVKTAYIVSALSFIAAVMTATWTYRWYLLTDQVEEALIESTKLLINIVREGLNETLSTEQQRDLEEVKNELQEARGRRRTLNLRLHTLLKRQDAFLYIGLAPLLVMILQIGIHHASQAW
jgi:hypothetical protein